MNTLFTLSVGLLVLSQTAPPTEVQPPSDTFAIPSPPALEASPVPAATPTESPEDRATLAAPTGMAAPPTTIAAPPAATLGQPPAAVVPTDSSILLQTRPTAAPPAAMAAPPAVMEPPQVAATSHDTADESTAATLLKNAVRNVDPAEFEALPTSLFDALRYHTESAAQSRAVKAYWRLCLAVARYHYGTVEFELVAAATAPQSQPEQALFEAERAAAFARQQQARLAVISAQYDVLETSALPRGETFPWPSDLPLVGPYRTNYDVLFAGRTAPLRLQRIHRLLPIARQSIDSRADALTKAHIAANEFSRAYAGGRAPLRSLLEAVTQWRLQRQAFFDSVLLYNDEIADYAMAVVGPVADPSTVVSTLIKWNAPPRLSPAVPGTVAPASAEEPVQTPSEVAPALRQAPPPAAIQEAAPPGGTQQEPQQLPQSSATQHPQSILRSIHVNH